MDRNRLLHTRRRFSADHSYNCQSNHDSQDRTLRNMTHMRSFEQGVVVIRQLTE